MHEANWLRLHPAARILSLALLTILLARLQWQGLLLAAGPLIWLLFLHPDHVKTVFRLVTRLRWFFLSILILYVWFTPGLPAIHSDGGTSFMSTGLMMGVERILALVIIVGYSGLLLSLSSRREIITGIYVLLSPLRKLGVDAARLAVRLGLVLECVPKFEDIQRSVSDSVTPSMQKAAWIEKFAMLFNAAVNPPLADRQEVTTIELPVAPHVSILDLVLPLVLAALIFTF